MDVDWVFNVEGLFIKKVKIGNLIVCEIPKCDKKIWCEAIQVVNMPFYFNRNIAFHIVNTNISL